LTPFPDPDKFLSLAFSRKEISLGIKFKNRVQKMKILNPGDSFRETVLTIETRWDPLTRRTARVLDLPIIKFPPESLEDMLKKGGRDVCPFCPEVLEKTTPQFPTDFIPEGRMRRGEVCIFPNRIPFDRHCAVVIFTEQHYVPLADFTEEGLLNAFSSSCAFLRRVRGVDPSVRYSSINWNYLPMSGGSIIHPHLQILAGEFPTYYQGALIKESRRYQKRWGNTYWEALIETERNLEERYIHTIGNTVWLTSYAPLGITDILCVFKGRTSIVDLPDHDLTDFTRGLIRIFRYFREYNHTSFNLGLYSGDDKGDDSFWVNARLMTRRTLPPVGASDVSYFEKIHKESLDYRKPERICKEMQGFFQE
jgi:UDPglucose--hexose-1-phosphate uridylyltransferase